ncbi:unnamed protein product [Microthlaspi erraticum]|uniref:Myb-like domain-containing protein n=1 Tax=Microthlaspi erraticum TaxID=1685480 RepID=A0A6D2IEH6_9BRAS|nr:unnamed protein product [Microthlaspi erraticum]
MGSNSPFNYSFTNLLHHAGTPPLTPLFCTQTPTFYTQSPEPGTPLTPDDEPEHVAEAGSSREARTRWTVPEDKALISAWLNTSKDAVTATDQKGVAFWKRVTTYYAECEAVKNMAPRKSNNCKQRWQKINEGCQRFCGCFEEAGRQATSGQSDDDVYQMAYKFFFQDQKSNFLLEHAWRALRNEQKWCELTKGKGKGHGKRAQPHTSAEGNPMEDEVEERPMGVKLAKAAKLKGTNKTVPRTKEEREASLKNLQTVAAIREKQFENKNKLANKQLLDTLLGKTEPLTEIENALKNALITRIYSL